jgi:hypothetical protein
MRDAREVAGLFQAACFVYAGYELVKVEIRERNQQVFTILVPELDYIDLKDEYLSGKLQISDAQSLGKTYGQMTTILRDMRRDQSNVYINPDYAYLMQQSSRTS